MKEEPKFKLPIEYNKHVKTLTDTVKCDLELVSNERNDTTLYHSLFDSDGSDEYSGICINKWNKYYSTDKKFLSDTQQVINGIDTYVEKCHDNDMLSLFNEISSEDVFMEKYVSYMEWNKLEALNHNETFLQLSGIYHIVGPVVSVIIPIAMFLIPFFIMKSSNVTISIGSYMDNLKGVISKRGFNINGGSETNMYLVLCVIMYILQIYQNIMACIKFHKTVTTAQYEMNTVYSYLNHTTNRMKKFNECISHVSSYNEFRNDLHHHLDILRAYEDELLGISSILSKTISISDITEIGKKLKTFYSLHNDKVIWNSVSYSIHFNGYINNMLVLNNKLKDHAITHCKFTKKSSKISKGYFIGTMNDKIIGNTTNLSHNIVITGPNASGKTTIMKGVIFNQILSQQIGCGCYKKASISMYDYFHSYMNIPDTSGRDSLFQAEARRCNDILKSIETQKGKHFCIFDELYSGTNPTDAVSSAMAFIGFLDKTSGMTFMLTTHYTELCNYVKDTKNSENYHMDVCKTGDDIHFKYKLLKGISSINGGFSVLKKMDYPVEILNDVIKYSGK